MTALDWRVPLPAIRPIPPALSTWLDLFRWLAAFAVCSSHLRAVLLVEYDPALPWPAKVLYALTGFGHEAVVIFFVLSGYLVGGEVLRGVQADNFSATTYAVRRFARLYAVYPVALVLGAVWDNVGWRFFNASQVYNAHDPLSPMFYFSVAERLTLPGFAGNLLFLQEVVVRPFGSNSALWSLAYEVWYYLLFPLLAWALASAARMRGRLTCLLLAAAAAWIMRGDMMNYFALWLLGVLPHFLRGPVLRPAWLAPAATGLILLLHRGHAFGSMPRIWGHLLLAGAFILWLNTLEYRPRAAPGGAGVHRFLAGFSYSLYLTHWPVLLLACAVLQQQAGVGLRMPLDAVSLALGAALLAGVYLQAWTVAAFTEHHTPALRTWLADFTGRQKTRNRPPR